jgi:hypothetical protein
VTLARRAAAVALTVGTLLSALTGCVGNAQTTGAYRGKAHLSAEAAVSALQTAKLAVDSSAKGNLFDGYLEIVLSQAEDDLGSVQQQFDSIQPPNSAEADRLRDRLDTLLSRGASVLADLRIAARRDEQSTMIETAADIPMLADKLDAFAEATA